MHRLMIFGSKARIEQIVVDVPDVGIYRMAWKDRSTVFSDERVAKDLEKALRKEFANAGSGKTPVQL